MNRLARLAGIVVVAAVVLTACGAQDDGILRQITPGSTVYIDGWDENAEEGDQALVEQKPSGVWVVPEEAPIRRTKSGDFTVEVTLTGEGQFVVQDLGGVKVGKDHDDCLALGEVYAAVAVDEGALQWEPEAGEADTSNDDCERVQSE